MASNAAMESDSTMADVAPTLAKYFSAKVMVSSSSSSVEALVACVRSW